MNILIFSNWFPPVNSGSSYYACSLAQSLVERGNHVCVVTLDWGPGLAPSSDMPFSIHVLPAVKLPKLSMFYNLRVMGIAFTPGNYKRLRKIVADFKPDVIHHVNHIFDTTFLTKFISYKTSTPIVGSITTPIQHQTPWKQFFMGLADRWTVGGFGIGKWDGIVCLDATTQAYAGLMCGEKALKRTILIPFGVRKESMNQYENSSEHRALEPTILMVGHIHPFRNPVMLVRAMPYILKKVPNARLILAGRIDLPDPVNVAKELGLNDGPVKFLGETKHEQTIKLFQTAHVFASWVTGPYHSLGTAPMEAMLCRTPVVNDLPEDVFGKGTLRAGENIIFVNSLDPESIAEGIIPLLTQEEERQRIGEAGRKFVLEYLGWDNIAGQMEAFYHRVIKAKREGKSIGDEA